MHISRIPFLSILILALAMVVASCDKKGCTDPDALNFDPDAVESDGSCVYNLVDEFPGVYSISELCDGSSINYVMEIRSVIPGSQVAIDNFADLFWDVNAFVNGNNISIPPQTYTFGNETYVIDGFGSVNGNLISLSYNIDDTDYLNIYGFVQCSATGSR